MLRAILLDVEGTTTPIPFVYETLFPYARKRLKAYVETHWEGLRDVVEAFQQEAALDLAADREDVRPVTGRESLVHNALLYMNEDRKAGCLKTLQGRIWEDGYKDGALKGAVYPDVLPAFERWSRAGLKVAIYSSGSVRAQKLLFGFSAVGDLTRFLTDHFDTAVGPKREAESYRSIAGRMGLEGGEVLFATDLVAEAEAASQTGMGVVVMRRPENPDPGPHPFPEAADFSGPPFP
ncbi:MAG: acireductone synthase [Candidatus Eremiobacterota bacterium]